MIGFDSLIGQNLLKARLGKAINELPGHAFVFVGPDGIGKTSFARQFAMGLLCFNPGPNGGCGVCPSCKYFIQGSHPDYKELLLKEKEKTIKTDVIRKVVCGDILMLPQISKRKVYFIDADDINEQGQNALLKTLEEPPEYAVIILAVLAAQNLLATILSRVIHVQFQRNTTQEIVEILKNHEAGADKPYNFIAKFADGIPGVALQFLENDQFPQFREDIINKMVLLPNASRSELLIDYFTYFDSNKQQVEILLDIMNTWIRDLIVYRTCKDSAEFINDDKREEMKKVCPLGENSITALANADKIIHAARRGIELNASFENCICSMLLQLRKELKNA